MTAPFGLLIPLTGPGWRLVLFVAGTLVLFAGILVYNVTAVAWRQDYHRVSEADRTAYRCNCSKGSGAAVRLGWR